MSLHEPDTAAPAVPAPGAPGRPSFLRDNLVTLVALAVATVLAGIIWFGLPHDREVTSVGMLLFKLTPFAAASIAVAWLDVGWANRLRLPLVVLPLSFLVFFCYFVPKIFFFAGTEGGFGELYYHVLTLVPFIILALVAAYRFGGGSRQNVLRLSGAMILLQLSGLEDLAFLTVNTHTDPRFTPIPEVWEWASHITVFLGAPPTKEQAYAFIAVHVVLALLVLFLPARALRRGR
jgi:hypothetical protein